MASFTKLTISVLKVFPSYTEIKRVMVDNDMNLESHIQLVDIVKRKKKFSSKSKKACLQMIKVHLAQQLSPY